MIEDDKQLLEALQQQNKEIIAQIELHAEHIPELSMMPIPMLALSCIQYCTNELLINELKGVAVDRYHMPGNDTIN